MAHQQLILNRYRPIAEAGAGGFGTVQVAWDTRIQRKVAIKCIELDEFDAMHLALFDETRSYLLDDEARFEREKDKNLPNPVRVHDVPAPTTSILKASVYCDDEPMDLAYILTRELDDDFVFAPSGRKWIDVMQRGVTKATGIRQVLDAHGIRADEMMAFGDSMNDYEILRMAGISMAMGNARPAIKQIATKVIGTNADYAVQHELLRLL